MERIAIHYSVIRTCALHGIDAFAYLKDCLGKLAAGWRGMQLDALLPENWDPRLPRHPPKHDPDPTRGNPMGQMQPNRRTTSPSSLTSNTICRTPSRRAWIRQ